MEWRNRMQNKNEMKEIISSLEAYQRAEETIDSLIKQYHLISLSGGYNNSVYLWNYGEEKYCIKIYKHDDRNRAYKEWALLSLLKSHEVDFVPKTYYHLKENIPEIVIMEYFEGIPFAELEINNSHLLGLSKQLQTLYSLTPEIVKHPLWSVNCNSEKMYINVVNDIKSIRSGSSSVLVESKKKITDWINGFSPQILLENQEVCLSKGDPSLFNFLWGFDHCRMIDFEYGGWTDKVFDLADLVEHVQSRKLSDESWEWFVDQIGFSSKDKLRYRASQQLCSIFWLLKFWPRVESDIVITDKFSAQFERVQKHLF